MTWYPRNDYESPDVDDEAGVGLMAPKSESTARRPTEQRQSWITKSSLSIVLILSNIVWAGLCLLLWRELHISGGPAHVSHHGFEADFGTFSLMVETLIQHDTEQSL
jgi:hypothetical protein